jgi:hypothetical protein
MGGNNYGWPANSEGLPARDRRRGSGKRHPMSDHPKLPHNRSRVPANRGGLTATIPRPINRRMVSMGNPRNVELERFSRGFGRTDQATSACSCSTTFPKKTKRGGHGRRHARYCSLRHTGLMAEDPRRSAERRRALELLDASPDGCTAAILLAHGFKSDRLVELINAGLASVTTERVIADDRAMEVTRVRITDAGRRAPHSRP